MRLIVGLGNPGEKYRNNRHNVGFMVVDRLKEDYCLRSTDYGTEWEKKEELKAVVCSLKSIDVLLAKPQTFMNSSGSAVKNLATRYLVTGNSKRKTSHEPTSYKSLFVIHDDLDIPLGEYKIQKGKGPKLHYGVQSVEEALGTPDFWRVRVGVDNRSPGNRASGEQYVLQDFTQEEKLIVTDVIERIIADLKGRLDL